MKNQVGHSGGGVSDQKKSAVGRGRGALRETSEKIGEVRAWSGRMRTAMGQGQWSDRKALIGHSGGGDGCQKKRAARRTRGALREMLGTIEEVRAWFGWRRKAPGTVVGEVGSVLPQRWWRRPKEEGGLERKMCTS